MCRHALTKWKDISLLIIAGGKSTRLGTDKRNLPMSGCPLLERILRKGTEAGFGEILLSVDEALPNFLHLASRYGAKVIVDDIPGAGSVGGLSKGLSSMSGTWGLAVAVDLPFLEFDALIPLKELLVDDEKCALIPVQGGHHHYLTSFYRRDMAAIFSEGLRNGERKIGRALERVSPTFIEMEGEAAVFFNINTPADLRLARGREVNLSRALPMISVIAPASGTGKTTFIERLLPMLTARGLRVGVIKSDSHGFRDTEGKDSERFQRAGAGSVAVVSPRGWMMIERTETRASFFSLAEKMEHVDLVLTESRTHGSMPALSLWRGNGMPITGEDVVTLFTSEPRFGAADLYEYHIDDMEKAVELCLFLMGR